MYRQMLIVQNRLFYLKQYLLNEALYVVGQYLFLIGIIYSLNITEFKPLVYWALINFTCYKVCLFTYYNIRTSTLATQLNTETNMLFIIFNYITTIFIENILLLIPLYIYFQLNITINDLVYMIIIILPFTFILSIIFFCMSILWKRILIILSIFTMYLLFYSGFVLEQNGLLKLVNYNSFTDFYSINIITLIVLLIVCIIVFKITMYHIRTKENI